MTERRRLFCERPFRNINVAWYGGKRGDVYMCCSAWLNRVTGNLQDDSVDDIWNGKIAQEVRESILDGSFSNCDAVACPYLQTVTGPVQPADEVKNKRMRAVIDEHQTVLDYGPAEVDCSYDRSCNISCPSCRTEKVIETHARDEILAIQEKLEREALGDAEVLYITGSGDAFGSPYFNRWLRTMRMENMPHLEVLHLHSNGLLWNRQMWEKIPEQTRSRIKSAEISIDAASAETYAVNRRGGDFERLLENLEFIGELRERGPLEILKLSMVVQANNFHEMPAFVEIGERFHADIVYFSRLTDWMTYAPGELENRSVHLPDHPQHQAFLKVVNGGLHKNERVTLGNLTSFVRAELE